MRERHFPACGAPAGPRWPAAATARAASDGGLDAYRWSDEGGSVAFEAAVPQWSRTSADMTMPYPLRLGGELDPRLSRWLWLVKWPLVPNAGAVPPDMGGREPVAGTTAPGVSNPNPALGPAA